jgi:alanyl-tRNA synthetase
VLDVQPVAGGLAVHTVRIAEGELSLDLPVLGSVDPDWRRGAEQAHSATHVIHEALRRVLGPSAVQAGSYNTPGRMRLDFSWASGLSTEQMGQIEDITARLLRHDYGVRVLHMTLPEAREFGAMALFGEKYGTDVRVVEIGEGWSRELCGGTHVEHASQIGSVSIMGEASIGSGVRRIEALVGLAAMERAARDRVILAALADTLNVAPDAVPERVAALASKVRELERTLAAQRAQTVLAGAAALAEGAIDIAGTALVAAKVPDGTTADDLRTLALDIRVRLGDARSAVVVLGTATDGRVSLVAATTEAARSAGIKAGALIKELTPLVGGGGGGRDDVAQGGGSNADGLPAALDRAAVFVREQLMA